MFRLQELGLLPPDNSPYTSARPAPNPSLLQVRMPPRLLPPLLLPLALLPRLAELHQQFAQPATYCTRSLAWRVPWLQLQGGWVGQYADVIARHAQQQDALAQRKVAAAAAKRLAAAAAAQQAAAASAAAAAAAAAPGGSMLTAALHGLPAHLQHAGQPGMMPLGLMQQLMSMQAQQQHIMGAQQ